MRSPFTAALPLVALLVLHASVAVPAPPPGAAGHRIAAELEGILSPSEVVDVSAAAEGLLDSVLVDRGDYVQTGQLVAELDMDVQKAVAELARIRSRQVAAIKASEIRLQRLEEKLDDHQALFEDGILSSEDLRETRAEKELAEFALVEARENKVIAEYEYRRALSILRRGRIKSPVAGVVLERHRGPGEIASRYADEPIFRIAKLDPIVVDTVAPVEHLSRVHAGMHAEVLIDEPVPGTHLGRVTVVDPVVDPRTRTFGVQIEIPNPDYALVAGLRCRIRILP